MEIIDLTKNPEESSLLKKIELKSCLQFSKNEEGEYRFWNSDFGWGNVFKFANVIKRLTRITLEEGEYDLIQVDNNIFIGYWNDGIV